MGNMENNNLRVGTDRSMEKKMLTPQEIYAMATETEQDAMQVLQTLKELRRELENLKEGELTIAVVKKLLSNKTVEIEALLTDMLKRQEGSMSDAIKNHGIRFLLRDN